MQVESALKLLTCIFRVPKAILWESEARSGDRTYIRVADEGQYRMVEGRR